MKQISTATDSLTKKNIVNRISDIPGGVSLTVADLVASKIVEEGTPLSAPTSGKRTVCKAAKLVPGVSTTVFKTASETNPFKVGDVVTLGEGMIASAILTIETTAGVDTITTTEAIDDPTGLLWLYQANAAATGATTYTADATLNIAYDNDTCAGLTADATSEKLAAPTGSQGTVATIVGTISTTGDATVTVSSDLLAENIVLSVGVLENDTADVAAQKIRLAMLADADIVAVFDVVGEGTEVGLIRTLTAVTDGSVFKNQPDVILKDAFTVPTDTMVILVKDAYLRADVREGSIAPAYLAKLPHIGVVKY